MEKLYQVKLHNRAHEGYRRAGLRLSKGEQVVEVTYAQGAQLEADARIKILSVSDVQSETADPCGGESGGVVSELVSSSIGTEAVIPSHYMPVIDAASNQLEPKRKSNRKSA